MKEGKPKRYSHYTNQPQIGDKLNLTYISNGEMIFLKLKNNLREYLDTSITSEKGKINSKIASFYNYSLNLGNVKSLIIRKDSLDLQNYTAAGGNYLEMKRYYKSDWQAIFTIIWIGETQIITLDCRNKSDKIDEIIERYKTYPGRLKLKK